MAGGRPERLAGWFATIALLLALPGCELPNPYDTSPPPQRTPPTGQPPQLPAPTEPAPSPEPQEEPQPAPAEPRTREYVLSSASRALVTQAQSQAAAGNYSVAAGAIERALRIEPSNPLLWIELGKIRQAEGNYAQAQSMGQKALSLATGDARAQASSWRLIAGALRAQGRVQEAQEAEARADALVPR